MSALIFYRLVIIIEENLSRLERIAPRLCPRGRSPVPKADHIVVGFFYRLNRHRHRGMVKAACLPLHGNRQAIQ